MTTVADHADDPFIAYVGCYAEPAVPGSGGIAALAVSRAGDRLRLVHRSPRPDHAAFLGYAPSTGTLYAVDERKTDGRGPVHPPAAVHALRAADDGTLTWLNSRVTPGPYPSFLDLDDEHRVLVVATHGGFEHVERIVPDPAGGWSTRYVYDDSAALVFDLQPDGRLGPLRDVHVMTGHGEDPNFSPQADGHGQAGPHAHCAVIDPSRRYLLVADKGTDEVHVFTLGHRLQLVHSCPFPPATGPRHIAFRNPTTAFLTCEFASELVSLRFDPNTGALAILDRVSTLDAAYNGPNEPADVRVHPNGRFVYVNNRGEDSLAWFSTDDAGRLERLGQVSLAPSTHPGLAARSFTVDPTGRFLLLADRAGDVVRSYRIEPLTGALTPLTELGLHRPAFIVLVNSGGTP